MQNPMGKTHWLVVKGTQGDAHFQVGLQKSLHHSISQPYLHTWFLAGEKSGSLNQSQSSLGGANPRMQQLLRQAPASLF